MIVALLVLAAAASAEVPPAPPMPAPVRLMNVGARHPTSLDGEWASIVDPYEAGYVDFHGKLRSDGFFENRKPARKSDLVEYDFDASPRLRVPGDWNTQRESLFFYEGTVWYERAFDYELPPGRRLLLHFGAAANHAVVYLNGQRLGEHEGGFAPFAFEITGTVRPHGNFVVVKVDNVRHPDGVPGSRTDWWNYGGLTRSVRLVELPETFVEDYALQLEPAAAEAPREPTVPASAAIAGYVQLRGAHLGQTVRVEIPEAGAVASVRTDAKGYAAVRFSARLRRWWPDHPKLYEVRVVAETDRVTDEIGFRTVEAKGDRILLNGRSVFLRGISLHEETPDRGARGPTAEDVRKELGWARDLGANFVRLAHYPHDEQATRAADRLGFLVWSEIPVYWAIDFGNPATYERARQQLEDMIARDRNRASVVFWSIGNETPITAARNDFMARLAAEAHRLDRTRLVAGALLTRMEGNEMVLDDPLSASLDVMGCNEYIGWYGEDPPEKADLLSWRNPYGKPLVISEFGADALQGRHGDPDERWTEEYQENLYRHQVAMLARIPFLRGVSPWILMDFRSPRRPLPGIQDYWNRKGLVDEHGVHKKAFDVLQKFYRERSAE